MKEWEQLAQEVSTRNQDLSSEQADQLADQFVRDVIDDMVEEGKIKFKSLKDELSLDLGDRDSGLESIT